MAVKTIDDFLDGLSDKPVPVKNQHREVIGTVSIDRFKAFMKSGTSRARDPEDIILYASEDFFDLLEAELKAEGAP